MPARHDGILEPQLSPSAPPWNGRGFARRRARHEPEGRETYAGKCRQVTLCHTGWRGSVDIKRELGLCKVGLLLSSRAVETMKTMKLKPTDSSANAN